MEFNVKPERNKPRIWSFLPFVIWVILIFILLTLPANDFRDVGLKIPHLDKLVHMSLFGGIVFWFGLAFLKVPFSQSKSKIITMVMISIGYGIIMEFVQKYCSRSRSFSYDDMLADAVGAILGYILIKYILQKADNSGKKGLRTGNVSGQ